MWKKDQKFIVMNAKNYIPVLIHFFYKKNIHKGESINMCNPKGEL